MAEPHIVIVGAGPAGIRAAEALVEGGLRPVVIDEAPRGGGQIYRRPPSNFCRAPEDLYGSEASKAVALHRTFDEMSERIDYRPETTVWGLSGNRLFFNHGELAEEMHFDRLILAPGATDRILPVPGWTSPGVYTLGAAQVALKAQGVAIGRRVIFMGSGPLLLLVAAQYHAAGAAVAAVLDTSHLTDQVAALPKLASRLDVLARGIALRARLLRAGIPVHQGIQPREILSDGTGVTGITWLDANGDMQETTADAIGMGWHLRPETQLAELARSEMEFDVTTRLWRPRIDEMGRSSRPDVYLAGDGARTLGADGAECAGRLVALAVLEDMGDTSANARAEARRLQRHRKRMVRFAQGIARAFPVPIHTLLSLSDDTVLCRCEAITCGDYRRQIGFVRADEVNRAKALSRVGMGRCQGRYCGFAAAALLAAEQGIPVSQAGRLRPQAPIKPLPVNLRVQDG